MEEKIAIFTFDLRKQMLSVTPSLHERAALESLSQLSLGYASEKSRRRDLHAVDSPVQRSRIEVTAEDLYVR